MKEIKFLQDFPDGLYLNPQIYEKLVKAVTEDCNFLEGVAVTDYSVIIAVRDVVLVPPQGQHQPHQGPPPVSDDLDSMDRLTPTGRM